MGLRSALNVMPRISARFLRSISLVSYFIQWLLPTIRCTVAEQMKNFVEEERGSMLTARPVAAAEGRSVRDRMGDLCRQRTLNYAAVRTVPSFGSKVTAYSSVA